MPSTVFLKTKGKGEFKYPSLSNPPGNSFFAISLSSLEALQFISKKLHTFVL